MELEKLSFHVWDCFLRCPGEVVDNERRLEEISIYYQQLSNGKNCSDLIQDSVELLQEVIEDCNEQLHSSVNESNGDYYIGRLKDCELIMDTVEKLLGLDKDMDKPAELLREEREEQ